MRVLFYFTRAASGVDAADWSCLKTLLEANIWISENGFDPSLVSLQALDNLDSKTSSLSIKFEKANEDPHLFCPENRIYYQPLEASVKLC